MEFSLGSWSCIFCFGGVTPDHCQGHHSGQSASQPTSVWKINYLGTEKFPKTPASVVPISECCKYFIFYLLNDRNTSKVLSTYSEPSHFLSSFRINLCLHRHTNAPGGHFYPMSQIESRTDRWRSHCRVGESLSCCQNPGSLIRAPRQPY